jgi:hypothetical protein
MGRVFTLRSFSYSAITGVVLFYQPWLIIKGNVKFSAHAEQSSLCSKYTFIIKKTFIANA